MNGARKCIIGAANTYLGSDYVSKLRWLGLASCVALAAVLLAACGSDEPESDVAMSQPTTAPVTQPTAAPTVVALTESAPAPAAATAAPAQPSVEVGLDVGQRAPDFTLTNLEGESVTRASLEGRPVMIYFFTTW